MQVLLKTRPTHSTHDKKHGAVIQQTTNEIQNFCQKAVSLLSVGTLEKLEVVDGLPQL